jgi:hypothetical protein
MQQHGAIELALKADRQTQAQLAALGLLALTRVQSDFELVQLGFAHHPRQPQEQTIMIAARVVELFAVGNQGAEYGAQLDQSIPIAIVTGKSRGVQADHETDAREPDLGDQLLKAQALLGRGPALAEIIIDNLDPFPGPAQGHRAVHQPVLQLRALAMARDLAQ